MDINLSELCAALRRGPAVLLLGQSYLSLESETDPFLSATIKKYGTEHPMDSSGYDQLLKTSISSNPEQALTWMKGLCDRIPVPRWLKYVADFPWNAVYSSAIDSLWPKAFNAPWRSTHPLVLEKYNPSDPRNSSNLHLTCLFGLISRLDEEERPPVDSFSFNDRRQVAISLARRLPEVVTPRGVLLIEAYAGSHDWLSPDNLLPIINRMNPGQVHFFSSTPVFSQLPDVRTLVDSGKLVLHEESLFQVLSRATELGFLEMGPRVGVSSDRYVQINGQPQAIPQEIWRQVSRSATILDDSILLPPKPSTKESLYQQFRTFLVDSGNKPVWSGYAQGLNFKRNFESPLLAAVLKDLSSKDLQRHPIILHGQTGTGKTVALGALAHHIVSEGKYPVIFIERKTERPNPADVELYCQWVEKCGAPYTLLVWDGMLDVEQYFDFLESLTSSGNKIVLVGSSYKQKTKKSRQSRLVEAPATLQETPEDHELNRLVGHISRFDREVGSALRSMHLEQDESFLVALYRLLPPTRGQIVEGVLSEVVRTQRIIADRSREVANSDPGGGAMAAALTAALSKFRPDLLPAHSVDIDGESIGDSQLLIGLVMVPGRFGLSVPLELLVRAMGRSGYSQFNKLFDGLDVFRWIDDGLGNISIAPRHSLEARQVVNAWAGRTKAEMYYIRKLLLEVRDTSWGGAREIEFAVDLAKRVGSRGLEPEQFAPYWKDLSNILRDLREARGVCNERLILQESNALREWVKHYNETHYVKEPTTEELLENTEHVLRIGLDLIESSSSSKLNGALYASMLVELATTLGTKITQVWRSQGEDRRQDIVGWFHQAKQLLTRARKYAPSSYYPVDVLAWMSKVVLDPELMSPLERAEVLADVLDAFTTIDPESLEESQASVFFSKKQEYGDILGDEAMADEAFQSLLRIGSCAGYYLRATKLAGSRHRLRAPNNGQEVVALSSEQRVRFQLAADYLESHRTQINQDSRCLNLLLQCWWQAKNGQRAFQGDHQTTYLSNKDWHYCLGLLDSLLALNYSPSLHRVLFLRGLALFQLGDYESAMRTFRDLEREVRDKVRGSRLIVRSYLLSDSNGKPITFNGTVYDVPPNGPGRVYIDDILRPIPFIAGQFRQPDLKKGDPLANFYIAFNFLGPIADHPAYYKSKSMRYGHDR